MPEFRMNGASAPEFKALDAFTQGYIEALFWTSCEVGEFDPENGSPLPQTFGFTDLAPGSLAEIVTECKQFQEANAETLGKVYESGKDGGESAYTDEMAGHDFWLTRNGHGAGFWDRGLGDLGDVLTKAAHESGESDAYLGDDGKAYVT